MTGASGPIRSTCITTSSWGTAFISSRARYYTQTAADFYHYSLVSGAALPGYAGADYRLAKIKSLTNGVKIAMSFGDRGEVNVRVSYMQQTGDSHPADAIGVQRTLDLYPGLQALMLQLGLTLRF